MSSSEIPILGAITLYERVSARHECPLRIDTSRPDPSVVQWLEAAEDERLFISVVSLGEIVKGISALPPGKRRTGLEQWLQQILKPWFGGWILSVTQPIAERWGALAAKRESEGRTLKVADGFIAATAIEHERAVVTRNPRDFEGLGAEVLNPWD